MNATKIIELNGDYYVINDEGVDVGDWFYCSDNTNYAHIFFCVGLTENTHLQVLNGLKFGRYDGGGEFDYEENPYGDWNICYSYKIIASTKELEGVPTIKYQNSNTINI